MNTYQRILQSIILLALVASALLFSSCDPSAVGGPKVIHHLEPEKHAWMFPIQNGMQCTMLGTPYNLDATHMQPYVLKGIMLDTTTSPATFIMRLDSIPVGMTVDSSQSSIALLRYLTLYTDTLQLITDQTTNFEFEQQSKSTNSNCGFTIHHHNYITNSDTVITHTANGKDLKVYGYALRSSQTPNIVNITLYYYIGENIHFLIPNLIISLNPRFW